MATSEVRSHPTDSTPIPLAGFSWQVVNSSVGWTADTGTDKFMLSATVLTRARPALNTTS